MMQKFVPIFNIYAEGTNPMFHIEGTSVYNKLNLIYYSFVF
jgi:hypothetical protein